MEWEGGRRILVVSQQKFTWSLPKALYYSKDPVLFAVTFHKTELLIDIPIPPTKG